MGLQKLTFSNYGALKEGQTFLFSTGQIFCQKLLYHIVAMIVAQLRIVGLSRSLSNRFRFDIHNKTQYIVVGVGEDGKVTLEKQTGFRLVTEQNTALRIPSLSTGMELYQDIFMKCLSIHSADIAQDHRWHWTYLCGKQIQGKKG